MVKVKAQASSDITEKWGESVSGRGFAQVPNYLLLANQFIEPRLDAVELLLLVQLVGTWWRKDELPFPSIATLAIRCGVSGRQIQRALAELESRNLLRRVRRRSQGIIASNAYDLSLLVEFLDRISKAFPNAFPRKPQSVRLPNSKIQRVLAKPKQTLQVETHLKPDGLSLTDDKTKKKPRLIELDD